MSKIYIRENEGGCDLVFSLKIGEIQSIFCINSVTQRTMKRLQYAIENNSRFHTTLGQTSKGEGHVTLKNGIFVFSAESGLYTDDFNFTVRVAAKKFKVDWNEIFDDFATADNL